MAVFPHPSDGSAVRAERLFPLIRSLSDPWAQRTTDDQAKSLGASRGVELNPRSRAKEMPSTKAQGCSRVCDRDQPGEPDNSLVADRQQRHQAGLHYAISGSKREENLGARLDPRIAVLVPLERDRQFGDAIVKVRRNRNGPTRRITDRGAAPPRRPGCPRDTIRVWGARRTPRRETFRWFCSPDHKGHEGAARHGQPKIGSLGTVAEVGPAVDGGEFQSSGSGVKAIASQPTKPGLAAARTSAPASRAI